MISPGRWSSETPNSYVFCLMKHKNICYDAIIGIFWYCWHVVQDLGLWLSKTLSSLIKRPGHNNKTSTLNSTKQKKVNKPGFMEGFQTIKHVSLLRTDINYPCSVVNAAHSVTRMTSAWVALLRLKVRSSDWVMKKNLNSILSESQWFYI